MEVVSARRCDARPTASPFHLKELILFICEYCSDSSVQALSRVNRTIRMHITADGELKLRIMQFKYDLVSRKYEVLLYRIRTGELIDVRELFAMQQQKQ